VAGCLLGNYQQAVCTVYHSVVMPAQHLLLLLLFLLLLLKYTDESDRVITGILYLKYEDRLAELDLTTLKMTRLRGDLIEVFKIFRGYYNINSKILFTKSQSNLRDHLLKAAKRSVRLVVGKYSYSNRVVNEWNMLNEKIIESSSMSAFRRKLDNHLHYNRGFI